jgi:hypothetical protein
MQNDKWDSIAFKQGSVVPAETAIPDIGDWADIKSRLLDKIRLLKAEIEQLETELRNRTDPHLTGSTRAKGVEERRASTGPPRAPEPELRNCTGVSRNSNVT